MNPAGFGVAKQPLEPAGIIGCRQRITWLNPSPSALLRSGEWPELFEVLSSDMSADWMRPTGHDLYQFSIITLRNNLVEVHRWRQKK